MTLAQLSKRGMQTPTNTWEGFSYSRGAAVETAITNGTVSSALKTVSITLHKRELIGVAAASKIRPPGNSAGYLIIRHNGSDLTEQRWHSNGTDQVGWPILLFTYEASAGTHSITLHNSVDPLGLTSYSSCELLSVYRLGQEDVPYNYASKTASKFPSWSGYSVNIPGNTETAINAGTSNITIATVTFTTDRPEYICMYGSMSTKPNGSYYGQLKFSVDGVVDEPIVRHASSNGYPCHPMTFKRQLVGAGAHTIYLQADADAGTAAYWAQAPQLQVWRS